MSDLVNRKIPGPGAWAVGAPQARWVDQPAATGGQPTAGSMAPSARVALRPAAGRTTRALLCLLASWLAWMAPVYAQLPLPLPQPSLDLRAGTAGGAVLALPDGGAIVAHGGRFVGGDTVRPQLFRIRPDGAVDTTWSVEPNGTVQDLALVEDDLYLAGSFTAINGISRRGLARVSLSTGALSDWNPNSGSTTNFAFNSLALAGDALYVGGFFTQIGITSRTHLAKIDRLTAVLDAGFNPSITGSVSSVRIDGTALFAGGSFTTVNGMARANAAKFSLASGALDPDWAPSFNSFVSRLEIDSGWLYATGCFSSVSGTNRFTVARVATAGVGAPDPTWNPVAPTGGCAVGGLHVDASHVYLSGPFSQLGGATVSNIGRVAKTGAGLVDATWNPVLDAGANNLTRLVGGSVVVVGQFINVNGAYQPGVVRVSGSAGATLGPNVYSEGAGNVVELAPAPDGGTYVGGNFHRVANSGLLRRGVLRLAPSGEVDPVWAPPLAGPGLIEALAVDATHLYLGGTFLAPIAGGQTRNNLIRVTHAGVIDSTWTPGAGGAVRAIAVDESSNSVFVGGSFNSILGQTRRNLAEVSRVTGTLTAFNPDANGTVRALALSGGTMCLSAVISPVSAASPATDWPK